MEDEYSAGSVSHLAVAMLYVRSLLLPCRAAVLWPPENKGHSVSRCFDKNAALRGWVRTMSMERVRNEALRPSSLYCRYLPPSGARRRKPDQKEPASSATNRSCDTFVRVLPNLETSPRWVFVRWPIAEWGKGEGAIGAGTDERWDDPEPVFYQSRARGSVGECGG